MGAVSEFSLKEDGYKRLYESLEEKFEYLEGFIGKSTVEKIKQNEKEIETLRQRVTEQDKEIAVLSNTVKEKESAIGLLRENREKEIREARKQERKQVERIKDAEAEDKVKNAKSNEAYKIRQNEVKPLKARYEALLEHIGETTDRIDENVIQLIGLVTIGFDKVEQLISEGKTQTEIKEAVEEIKRDTISKISKVNVAEECKMIHNYSEQGLSQKEIADIMYPDIERRYIKVTERIKSTTYKKLFSNG